MDSLTETRHRRHRRGAVVVLAAVMMAALLALFAFAVDMGTVCLHRTQAQAAADSSALAAAQLMVGEDRLRGEFYTTYSDARKVAAQYAALHQIGGQDASLQADDDVIFGRLDDPVDRSAVMDSSDPARYNAVTVNVQASAGRRTQARLLFASFIGLEGVDVDATATAAFADRIGGFRTTRKHPWTSLLPFTLKFDDWKSLLDSGRDDRWTCDSEDNTVSSGSDGIPEIKMYPIDSGAGNWGTVDIGNNNNSTADLVRQICYGVSSSDLAAFGGALELNGSTDSVTLNGDTGISAGMKSALATIIGQPRTIPLYSTAKGTGNNRNYQIVGFAGIRIVEVNFSGSNKFIRVQPAYVVDPTAISNSGAENSYFVTQPPRIVR
ncbi:MAG: hypothetical protein HUU20_20695 [Pirellulales bacterium]|nr:hypothetical protein [Pirellulales bacterium]